MKSFVSSLTLLALLVAGCQSTPEVKGEKIADLVKANRSPVEVLSIQRTVSPLAPTFRVKLRNISDSSIKAVQWTAVFVDADGQPLPDGVDEGGYADPLSPLGAGEELEGLLAAGSDAASMAKLVIKSVLYEGPNPAGENFGSLVFQWENPGHDAELVAHGSAAQAGTEAEAEAGQE